MTLKARETEYKGIVYRSKSEAMFARWLELTQAESNSQYRANFPSRVQAGPMLQGFIYEPDGFEVSGWSPDFLSSPLLIPVKQNLPVNVYEFIEYKPCNPTKTYVNGFIENCRQLHADLKVKLGRAAMLHRYMLYYGSPFYDESGIHVVQFKNETEVSHWDNWLEDSHREAIKATRFDLEAK